MNQTLYRKYRPQKFADLAGQNHIRVTLQNQIVQGKVSHAYVFCGPRGVGKTTTARLLAKALNCKTRKKNQSEPCNTCESCVAITQGRAMHILEIDAASNTGVDHVREHIIANAHVGSAPDETKVFIIDEVHMLSTSAFNALLKTLEEPPERVVFILATTEVHQLPDTILSRCQRFDFRKVDVPDLVTRLEQIASQEGIRVPRNVLERIARFSGGHLRDAESVMWQLFGLGEQEITMEHADLIMPKSDLQTVVTLFTQLREQNASGAIELLNTVLVEGGDLQQLTKDMIEFLRKLLLLSVSQHLDQFSILDLSPELMTRVSAQLDTISVSELKRLLEIWMAAQLQLSQATILQLPLELAVLESAPIAPVLSSSAVTPDERPVIEDVTSVTSSPEKDVTAPSSTPSTPLDAVISFVPTDPTQWSKFLEQLKLENHSLAITVGLAKVLKNESGALTLGFGYQFHCDRVTQVESKALIERAWERVFGGSVTITAVVEQSAREGKPQDPESVVPPQTTDADIVSALDVFEGKLIQEKKHKSYPAQKNTASL